MATPVQCLALLLLGCAPLLSCRTVGNGEPVGEVPAKLEETASKYFDRAEAAEHQQRYLEALDLRLKAMQLLKEEAGSPNPPSYRSVHIYLAILYARLGRYNEAEEAFRIYEQYSDSRHREWMSEGRWAKKKFREEFNFRRRGHLQTRITQERTRLIRVLVEHGELDEAEKEIGESMQLGEELERIPDGKIWQAPSTYLYEYIDRTCRAPLFTARGNYETMLVFLEAGFRIDVEVRSHMDKMYMKEPKVLLAHGYFLLRRDSEARKLYEESLLNQAGEPHPPLDLVLNGAVPFALIEERSGNPVRAEAIYRAGIDTLTGARLGYPFDVRKADLADLMNAYAGFNLRRGEIEKARRQSEESTALRMESQGPDHPNYADTLLGLADIAALQGDFAQAEAKVRQALEVLDNSLVPEHPRKAAVLAALAALTSLQGKGGADQTPEAAKIKLIAEKPLGPPYAAAMESIARYAGLLRAAKLESDAAALEALGKLLRESPGP